MKLVYYTMPFSPLAQEQKASFINFCRDRNIEYEIKDLKFITKPQEIMELKLHGIPTIRIDGEIEREIVGKFNRIDLETLCAQDAIIA